MRAGLPFAAAVLALVTGCASASAGTSVVTAPSVSSRPAVTGPELSAAATGSAALGLDVLRRLGAANSNVVLSPASLAAVLTMLLPGARGATATAIAAVLHDRMPAAELAAANGALQAASPGAGTTLRQADSLWTQRGTQPSAAYLRLLAADFGAGVHEVDFRADAEAARKAINAAVANQTEGLIKNLFPAGTIDSSTLLALVNAIYLHAAWQYPFVPELTAPRPFRLLNGATTNVPMMTGEPGNLGYAAGAGWQAAELPYTGGQLAMDVIMPTAGFAAFRDGLTAGSLASMLASMRPASVDLLLPKFTLRSNQELTGVLTRLGMGPAFGPGADFSGLGLGGTAISTVVQDAYIQVGEKGTTAAAATGVSIASAGRVVDDKMTVDRPFIFAIRNLHTGQILFLGQVTNPR